MIHMSARDLIDLLLTVDPAACVEVFDSEELGDVEVQIIRKGDSFRGIELMETDLVIIERKRSWR